jgi:hypothetical protein
MGDGQPALATLGQGCGCRHAEMDDVQGRVGTPGALLRKGKADEGKG